MTAACRLGHDALERTEHVDARARVAPPSDWTHADTLRLRAQLEPLAD